MAGPEGLTPQVISIPLQLGVNTKDSPQLVPRGQFVSIANARFVKNAGSSMAQMQARNGHTLVQGGVFTAGQSMAQLGNELDVVATDATGAAPQALYAQSPALNTWERKGPITTAVPTVTPIVRNSYTQSTPDSAYLSGLYCFAWLDTRGGVWCKVIDATSGSILLNDTQLAATGVNPRVTIDTAGTHLVVWWTDALGAGGTSNLNYAAIPTAAPTTAPATHTTTLSTAAAANTTFDVAIIGSSFYVGYEGNASSNFIVAQVNSSYTVTASAAISTHGPIFIQMMNLAGTLVATFTYAGNNLNSSFIAVPALTATNFTLNLGQATPLLGIVAQQGSSTTIEIVCQVEPYGAFDRTVDLLTCNSTTGFGGVSTVLRGVGMASRPFAQGGFNYFLACYASGATPSTVQQTYFLCTDAGVVVGRYVALDGASFPTGRLAQPATQASNMWTIPVIVQTELESSGGKPVIIYGLSNLGLDFTQTNVRTAQLGKDLTLAGGLPRIYDGAAVYENGFNVFPEAPTATLLSSQIGLINVVNGNSTTALQFTVVFPTNPDGSGNDGKMIIPGEYIYIESSYTASGGAFYFVVDGVGGAPPGFPNSTGYFSAIPVPISASNSATLVGNALYNAIYNFFQTTSPAGVNYVQPIAGGGAVTTYELFNIQGTGSPVGPGFQRGPFLGLQSFACFLTLGSYTAQAVYFLNLLPAKLLTGGQYFSWVTYVGGNAVSCYCWYKVGGVGVDPMPFAGTAGTNYFSIPVTVNATDSLGTVTANTATAINAVTGTAEVIATLQNSNSSNGMLNITNVNNGFGAIGTSTIGNGLGLATGTAVNGQIASYAFCAMYESVDAQGQQHRSSPSVATTLQFWEYGYHNAVVSIQTTMLRLTSRPTVDVAFYSTLDTGTLFYRVSSPTTLVANVTTSDYVTLQDSTADTALASNELMYTQPLIAGSVIPNNCPPAFTRAANFQDQLWINDSEDTQLWWYSKSFTSGVAVEFSDLQTWRFDPIAGPTVTAIAMDANLIVLGTLGVWAISGLGPDSTGAGAPFTSTLISSACGLRDPGSVVLTPDGIIFKSAKGFVLLDRGLQINMSFGNPVAGFNADAVTSAQVIPGTTEVRFLSQTGTTQLYDYEYGQWSPHSYVGVDSIVFQGNYYFMASNGVILEESAGYYNDGSVPFPLSFTTSWIEPGALQGASVVWRILLQGNFPVGLPLQVSIAYNYNPIAVDVHIITPTVANLAQILIHPQRTQLESIQLNVTDLTTFSSSSKYSVNMLDLECGIKRGSFKKIGPTAML